MAPPAGQMRLIKAGFVQLDPVTGQVLRMFAFQYNPETLTRSVETIAAPLPQPQPAPRETITFTVPLDAAHKLDSGDPVTQKEGIFPPLAALQVLLASSPQSLVVWVSGNRRVLPVRLTGMQITEQAFDSNLNPIRAEVTLTLTALSGQDLVNDSRGRSLLDAYLATLQQLAELEFANGSLATLGLPGI